ncbi:MAG: 3-dehydroquinate dehydratase [Bacillus subtilis]|nr:3-dehydroquinate dehydratase [Bacillus subtilis]
MGRIDYAVARCEQIAAYASSIGVETAFYQSNHEGALLDYIHSQLSSTPMASSSIPAR